LVIKAFLDFILGLKNLLLNYKYDHLWAN